MGLDVGVDDGTDLVTVVGIGMVASPPRPPDLGFTSAD